MAGELAIMIMFVIITNTVCDDIDIGDGDKMMTVTTIVMIMILMTTTIMMKKMMRMMMMAMVMMINLIIAVATAARQQCYVPTSMQSMTNVNILTLSSSVLFIRQ